MMKIILGVAIKIPGAWPASSTVQYNDPFQTIGLNSRIMSITVDEVCAKAGVSVDRLAQYEYTDDDILAGGLADVCDPWNLVGKHLGLQDSELNAIDGDYRGVEEKRVAVLQRRREGHLDGTYFLLVKALVSCKKVNKALKVCQVFMKSHPDGELQSVLAQCHDNVLDQIQSGYNMKPTQSAS